MTSVHQKQKAGLYLTASSLELYEPLAASYLPNVKFVDIVMLGKKMFDFTSHFRFSGNRGTILLLFQNKMWN